MPDPRPDPAAVLAELFDETEAAIADDPNDMLGNRLRGIEDVICTLPTDNPAALRVQAKCVRRYAADFQVDPHVAAIMTLAATYAERLATTKEV